MTMELILKVLSFTLGTFRKRVFYDVHGTHNVRDVVHDGHLELHINCHFRPLQNIMREARSMALGQRQLAIANDFYLEQCLVNQKHLEHLDLV
jgi:hypothetical protein